MQPYRYYGAATHWP